MEKEKNFKEFILHEGKRELQHALCCFEDLKRNWKKLTNQERESKRRN